MTSLSIRLGAPFAHPKRGRRRPPPSPTTFGLPISAHSGRSDSLALNTLRRANPHFVIFWQSGTFDLQADSNSVDSLAKRPKGNGAWINDGSIVLEPGVMSRNPGDSTVWEREPMEALAKAARSRTFRHDGFCRNIDSLRHRMALEEADADGISAWILWWCMRNAVSLVPATDENP